MLDITPSISEDVSCSIRPSGWSISAWRFFNYMTPVFLYVSPFFPFQSASSLFFFLFLLFFYHHSSITLYATNHTHTHRAEPPQFTSCVILSLSSFSLWAFSQTAVALWWILLICGFSPKNILLIFVLLPTLETNCSSCHSVKRQRFVKTIIRCLCEAAAENLKF